MIAHDCIQCGRPNDTESSFIGNGTRPSRTLKMTPSVMTFYWGARSKIQDAGHHTIFMPHDPAKAYDELIGRLEIPVELPFYMSIASKTDPSMAPKGCSNIFVLVPLPHSSHMEPTDWNTKIKNSKCGFSIGLANTISNFQRQILSLKRL